MTLNRVQERCCWGLGFFRFRVSIRKSFGLQSSLCVVLCRFMTFVHSRIRNFRVCLEMFSLVFEIHMVSRWLEKFVKFECLVKTWVSCYIGSSLCVINYSWSEDELLGELIPQEGVRASW